MLEAQKSNCEICVWTVNCATGKESLCGVPFRLQSPALIEVFLGSTEKRNCTFANLSLIFTLSHDAIVKAFWRIIGFSIYNRGPKHYFNLFTRLRTMARARPLGIWRRRFSKSAGIPTFKGLKYFYNWGGNDAIFYQRLINDWTFLHWAWALFAPPLSKLINSGWSKEGSGLTK